MAQALAASLGVEGGGAQGARHSQQHQQHQPPQPLAPPPPAHPNANTDHPNVASHHPEVPSLYSLKRNAAARAPPPSYNSLDVPAREHAGLGRLPDPASTLPPAPTLPPRPTPPPASRPQPSPAHTAAALREQEERDLAEALAASLVSEGRYEPSPAYPHGGAEEPKVDMVQPGAEETPAVTVTLEQPSKVAYIATLSW